MKHKERLAEINSRARDMEERIGSLESERKRDDARIGELESGVRALEHDRDLWKREAESLQKQLNEAKVQSAQDQAKIAELEHRLEEALEHLATAQAALDEWTAKCEACPQGKSKAKPAMKGSKRR